MTIDSKINPGLIAVDVGGGTQDIFVYLEGQSMENCPKMVMPSPTRLVAQRISAATAEKKAVFLFGETMGGGVCGGAAKRHIAAGLPVYATPTAALTFYDNLERVKKTGPHAGRPVFHSPILGTITAPYQILCELQTCASSCDARSWSIVLQSQSRTRRGWREPVPAPLASDQTTHRCTPMPTLSSGWPAVDRRTFD